jgi:hypothetical protein
MFTEWRAGFIRITDSKNQLKSCRFGVYSNHRADVGFFYGVKTETKKEIKKEN